MNNVKPAKYLIIDRVILDTFIVKSRLMSNVFHNIDQEIGDGKSGVLKASTKEFLAKTSKNLYTDWDKAWNDVFRTVKPYKPVKKTRTVKKKSK